MNEWKREKWEDRRKKSERVLLSISRLHESVLLLLLLCVVCIVCSYAIETFGCCYQFNYCTHQENVSTYKLLASLHLHTSLRFTETYLLSNRQTQLSVSIQNSIDIFVRCFFFFLQFSNKLKFSFFALFFWFVDRKKRTREIFFQWNPLKLHTWTELVPNYFSFLTNILST